MARSRQKAFGESANTHFPPLKAQRQLRKVVIPAVGLGTRMQPLAQGLSKGMLPIKGRSMISYAIHEAALSGLEELYIIINERKDALRRYLESAALQSAIRSEKKCQNIFLPRLTFVGQPTPTGSGDAIYRARELIGDESFALMMPDFILFGNTPALGQMIPLYEQCERDIVGLLPLQGKEAEGFGNVGIPGGRGGARGL